MAGIRDSLIDLEKHRLQLEQSVVKLRTSLQHWQAWEIEYEGMREEILGLRPGHTEAELEDLGKDVDEFGAFAGQKTLLTQHERKQLLLDEKGNLRDSKQVMGLLSRRIDYVQQNIKTVSSLSQTAEEKYAASRVLSQPEVHNEEGLPLTEIHEELDEDGNVISSSTSEPGKAAPQMLEVLQKAGVELPEPSETHKKDAQQPTKAHQTVQVPGSVITEVTSSQKIDPDIEDAQQSSPTSSESLKANARRRPSGPEKRVSFAYGTKEEVNHTPQNRSSEDIARIIKEIEDHSEAELRKEAEAQREALSRGLTEAHGLKESLERCYELLDVKIKRLKAAKVYQQYLKLPKAREHSSDDNLAATPVKSHLHGTSAEESREGADASLTSQSISSGEAYSRGDTSPTEDSECRPISDRSVLTQTTTSDTIEKSEVSVNNNPSHPAIPINESREDAALRRQMLQYNMGEVGAVVAELDLDLDEEYEEEPDDNSSVEENEDQYGRTKRRVLNNDYLAEMEALQKKLQNLGPIPGIAIPSTSNGAGKEQQLLNGKLANGTSGGSKSAEKKGVRFANELNVQEAPLPITTHGSPSTNEPKVPPKTGARPVLASVIERPYTASTAPGLAPEPDEYDPGLVQKEVSNEYHKMRNRMIQRQGGFMAQEKEQAEVPLTEAEGGPKKISRFKAARLGRA